MDNTEEISVDKIQTEAYENGFEDGQEYQKKIDIDKACDAYCSIECGYHMLEQCKDDNFCLSFGTCDRRNELKKRFKEE